jgi:hypothetical protein
MKKFVNQWYVWKIEELVNSSFQSSFWFIDFGARVTGTLMSNNYGK